MRQWGTFEMFKTRRFLREREMTVGFRPLSFSKTNLPDTGSELVPSWRNAYWPSVAKMRDVPCVFWRVFWRDFEHIIFS